MATLPPIRIEDLCSDTEWRVLAHAHFPGETITFDLRFASDASEWRPDPPRTEIPDDTACLMAHAKWRAVIEDTLRKQILWDNYRSLVEQARERSATPIRLWFFNPSAPGAGAVEDARGEPRTGSIAQRRHGGLLTDRQPSWVLDPHTA